MTDTSRTVTRLRIYPIKGTRGIDVEEMEFDAIGPVLDRRWMVVRPTGTFITQRENALLATLVTTPSPTGLWVEAPGAAPLDLPLTSDGPPLSVTVWRSVLNARTVGEDADQWLSQVLGEPVRLVYMADSDVRHTNPEYAPDRRVSFADGYPVLLVSEPSADEVSRRVGRPIPMERFRPNIVVTGERPHEEDRWRRITIAGGEGDDRPPMGLDGVKLCARCVVTTLDQETGDRDPAQRQAATSLSGGAVCGSARDRSERPDELAGRSKGGAAVVGS